jgi:uncharacterized protein YutE (UPF0331/DUF86 family)
MDRINIDRLAFLLGELHEARGKLKGLAQISINELLADGQKIDLIKYNLIIAIQSAIDVCYHIVAKSENRAPEDYADCFLQLAQLGIIEDRFAQNLKEMARFRNLLVHMYGKVDDKRVCQILKDNLTDLDRFEEQIKGFVSKL